MKQEIKYIKGDATAPERSKFDIIVHICNDIGGWGSGFVVAVSRRWKQPEALYRRKAGPVAPRKKSNKKGSFPLDQQLPLKGIPLGSTHHCVVDTNLVVVNMIAQRGIVSLENRLPVRYEALAACLKEVQELAKPLRATVHMPRIGCGLAGGTWDKVGPIVEEALAEHGIPVIVYDFE